MRTQQLTKKYKAKKGARISNTQANAYGRELEKIEDALGRITPETIVSVAKDKKNPLHEYFEWNNNKAGEKFRLHQARLLIGYVEIVISEDKEHQPRAFLNVKVSEQEDDEEFGQFYLSTERIMGNQILRANVVQKALKEAISWQTRWQELNELSEIFIAIDKTSGKY